MSQPFNITLEQALAAMNELNAVVRHPQYHGPRKAIYWLKSRYAIRDALMAGMLTKMRGIQVTTKCNRCRAGIYFDWNGYARGSCHTCHGTGIVTLKFIETTIADKFIWHSPLEYNSWFGFPADDLKLEESQDWTVNRPGKEVAVDDLAKLLNTVEIYWTQWRKHSPYEFGREEYDNYRYFYFNYSLDLGYGPKGCVLCGGDHTIYYSHTIKPGLTVKRSIYGTCEKLEKLGERLKALPTPDISPAIQLWAQRHTIDFGQTWKYGFEYQDVYPVHPAEPEKLFKLPH